jgi:hypothetical protein
VGPATEDWKGATRTPHLGAGGAGGTRSANASIKALRSNRLRDAAAEPTAGAKSGPLPAMYAAYGMTGIKPTPPPGAQPRAGDKPQVWPLPSWLASPYTDSASMPPVKNAPRRRAPWIPGRRVLDVSPLDSQEFAPVVPEGGRVAWA